MDLADLKEFVFSVKSALKNEISALIEMETEGEAQGKDYYQLLDSASQKILKLCKSCNIPYSFYDLKNVMVEIWQLTSLSVHLDSSLLLSQYLPPIYLHRDFRNF